jgi:DNA-binding transcriptional regulator YhcF (GntR family)
MTSSKIDFSYNRIRRLSDLSDLAEVLFPGNRNQQHAFLVIWTTLKWSSHRMVPNLNAIAEHHAITKRTLERVRAKLRRMGLIDHVSRFSQRLGYRDGWTLSTRFESSLRKLADAIADLRSTDAGSKDKDELLIQLADARRSAARESHLTDHEVNEDE